MIIRHSKATRKIRKPMQIWEYQINSKFSGALIEIDGDHGAVQCLQEDRIYFILEGKGEFVIEGRAQKVQKYDLIFVPKKTPYNIIGKMKYFLVCSPCFKPGDDVFLN